MALSFIKEELVKPHSECVPNHRSGHRMLADQNNLYVIGGYIQLSGPDDSMRLEVKSELWQFNLMSSTWTQLKFFGELPDLTASHDVVMIGRDILIHGGTGTIFGVNIDNKVHVVRLDSMVCLQVKTKPKDDLEINKSQPVYGHSLTYFSDWSGSFVYKFGGTDGHNYSNNMHRLDLHSGEWETVASDKSCNSPLARYRHETILYNSKLFIIGGGNHSIHGFKLQELPVFDLTNHQWHSVTTSGFNIFQHEDRRIRCQSCCLVESHVYFLGGLVQHFSHFQSLFRLICQLNMDTLSWQQVGLWSRPAYFHSACSIPELGMIFTFGGVCSVGFPQRSNAIYKFRVPMVVSLKELTWQTIVKSLRPPYKITTLYDLGVPDSYIKRIPLQFVSAA